MHIKNRRGAEPNKMPRKLQVNWKKKKKRKKKNRKKKNTSL